MDVTVFATVLAAAVLHASWNFFAKTTRGNKISVIWLGQAVASCIFLPIALVVTDFSNFEMKWLAYLAATGAIHAVYISLLGWSYSLGDMSVVYPVARGVGIALTATIAIAAGIDQVSPTGVWGVVAIAVGTLLIGLKEIPHAAARKAFLVAIAVGIAISGYSLVDKLAMDSVPPFFYVASLNLVSILLCSPLILLRFRAPTRDAWKNCKKEVFIIGLGGLGTYFIILWALQFGPASYIIALRETSVVLAAALGIWVLKESISKRKILGILSVMLGAYLIRIA